MGTIVPGTWIVRIVRHPDGRRGTIVGLIGGLIAASTVFIGLASRSGSATALVAPDGADEMEDGEGGEGGEEEAPVEEEE